MGELGEGTIANLTNAINQLTGQLSGGQWKSSLQFPTSQMALGGPMGLGGQIGGAIGGQAGGTLGSMLGLGAMMAAPGAFSGLRDSPYQSTYNTNMSQAVLRDSFAERGERNQAFATSLGLPGWAKDAMPFLSMLAPGLQDTVTRTFRPNLMTDVGQASFDRASAYNRNIRGMGKADIDGEFKSMEGLLLSRPSGLNNIMSDDVMATYEYATTKMGVRGESARNMTASMAPIIRNAANVSGLKYGETLGLFEQNGVNSLGKAGMVAGSLRELSIAANAGGDSTQDALAKANGLAGSTLLGSTLSMGLTTRAELIGAEGIQRGASAAEIQRHQSNLVRHEAGGQERDMRMKVAAYVALYGSDSDKAGLRGGGESFINRFAAKNATAISQISGEDIRSASTEDPATMRAAQQIRQNAMAKEAMARSGVDPRGHMGSADFLKLANAGLLNIGKGFQAEEMADRGAASAAVQRTASAKAQGIRDLDAESIRQDIIDPFKQLLSDLKNGDFKGMFAHFMQLLQSMAGNLGLMANTSTAGNTVQGTRQ